MPHQRPNAVVAACGHGHVVFNFVFGVEIGVWVKGFEHRIDARFYHAVGVHLVYIIHIQFFEHGGINIEVAGNLEKAVVLIERRQATRYE